jgi:hypothetical protein
MKEKRLTDGTASVVSITEVVGGVGLGWIGFGVDAAEVLGGEFVVFVALLVVVVVV